MPRRTPRRIGRPLALADDQAEKRLLDAVSQGVPLNHAATYAGIAQRTLYRTLARGEDADTRAENGEGLSPDDELCRDLWQRVARARAAVAVRNVAFVQRAASGGQLIERTTRTLRDGSRETTEKYAPPDARAAMWLLKTSFKEFAGPPDQLELTGAGGGPVQVQGDADTASRLAQRIGQLAAARRELETGDDVIEGELVDDDERRAS